MTYRLIIVMFFLVIYSNDSKASNNDNHNLYGNSSNVSNYDKCNVSYNSNKFNENVCKLSNKSTNNNIIKDKSIDQPLVNKGCNYSIRCTSPTNYNKHKESDNVEDYNLHYNNSNKSDEDKCIVSNKPTEGYDLHDNNSNKLIEDKCCASSKASINNGTIGSNDKSNEGYNPHDINLTCNKSSDA